MCKMFLCSYRTLHKQEREKFLHEETGSSVQMNRQGKVFPDGPYRLPEDSHWVEELSNAVHFPVIEAHIYRDSYSPMLNIDFEKLGHLGFTLKDFPEDHWEWLLGSISKQVSELVEKAYRQGAHDKQKEIRRALGVLH